MLRPESEILMDADVDPLDVGEPSAGPAGPRRHRARGVRGSGKEESDGGDLGADEDGDVDDGSQADEFDLAAALEKVLEDYIDDEAERPPDDPTALPASPVPAPPHPLPEPSPPPPPPSADAPSPDGVGAPLTSQGAVALPIYSGGAS